jgi:ECF sigma factor
MPKDQSGQVAALLQHWRQGDENALQPLVLLVYKELRRLAHCRQQAERPDYTLQSTALVHEDLPAIAGSRTGGVAESHSFHRHRLTADAQNTGGLRP